MVDARKRPITNSRRRAFLAAAGLLAAAAGGAWWYAGTSGATLHADPGDPVLVALGRTVYADYCADCHGKNLEGAPDWRIRGADGMLPAPPHDETGHTWHHPDKVLLGITKLGTQAFAPPGYRSSMPGYGEVLSDREIVAVLAFIKSSWPEKISKRQERIDRQSK